MNAGQGTGLGVGRVNRFGVDQGARLGVGQAQ